jgi:NAD(P)-dependent dehydrogenase (short-subunit alcohol dehydrogenase family)
MDLQLAGKVAVITGGSIGIGLATAEGLAQEGAHVVLCARQEDRLQQQADAIRDKYGVRALGVKTDVTNPDDIARLAQAVEDEFGGVDILFNNAGTGSNETIMEAPDDKWQYYWELHVMAAVRMSRALVPLMRQRGGGVILNNASICATQPLWYEPIYNVTKAALVMLSKTMAHEFIGDNIRVNTLNAGLILTPDWKKSATELTAGTDQTPEEYLDQVVKDLAVPIKRFASPEELAHFIVFLCSPLASYSVGSTYYVDGGMLKVTT